MGASTTGPRLNHTTPSAAAAVSGAAHHKRHDPRAARTPSTSARTARTKASSLRPGAGGTRSWGVVGVVGVGVMGHLQGKGGR